MKKLNSLSWFIIVFAIITGALPYVRNYPFETKALSPVIAVSMLSALIENKRIRLAIATVCLIVVGYIFIHFGF